MGLWEQTTVTTIKVNLPNAVNGKPQTVVSQTCITPETWREAYDPQGGDKGGDLGCKIKNLKQSASGFSADITCGTSSGHTQTTFESPEKITGSMHIDTAPGDKQPGFMEQTFVSVYKGADCKDIAPGDEKLISD
ncbi:MAG: DUF3617 domain-containing protein [Acidobacteriaceae bacterium]|nr:DUF3617 domain-containing protein [Acidobacteriaceae bacterium]